MHAWSRTQDLPLYLNKFALGTRIHGFDTFADSKIQIRELGIFGIHSTILQKFKPIIKLDLGPSKVCQYSNVMGPQDEAQLLNKKEQYSWAY